MVDTERMRAVLERVGTGGPPPPPKPAGEELGELLRRERELWELCRFATADRRTRAALERVRRQSLWRQERLRRARALDAWDHRPPPPPPPPRHPEGPVSRLRRAWQLAGELERQYGRAAESERDRQRRGLFRQLERSAAESRDILYRLLNR